MSVELRFKKKPEAERIDTEAAEIAKDIVAALQAEGYDLGNPTTTTKKPTKRPVAKSAPTKEVKKEMPLSNKAILEKAVMTSADFGGAGEAPLSVEQVKEFIKLMQAEQVMLKDVRTVTSRAAKWEESILDFSSRMMRPGTQGSRLAEADRTKPTTGNVTISTVLLRGEVGISEEVFEDTAAADFDDSLAALIADRAGFDVEDLMVNGDVASPDIYLAQLDGWLKQATVEGNTLNAASLGQDYQAILHQLVITQPNRFKRSLTTEGRFYVPTIAEEKYRDILSSRGTALGDLRLEGKTDIRYQGILIKGAPTFGITAGSPDTSHFLLTDRRNLYAGFQRVITLKRFEDPREGMVFFIPTVRCDAQIAVPEAVTIATSVNVEP